MNLHFMLLLLSCLWDLVSWVSCPQHWHLLRIRTYIDMVLSSALIVRVLLSSGSVNGSQPRWCQRMTCENDSLSRQRWFLPRWQADPTRGAMTITSSCVIHYRNTFIKFTILVMMTSYLISATTTPQPHRSLHLTPPKLWDKSSVQTSTS